MKSIFKPSIKTGEKVEKEAEEFISNGINAGNYKVTATLAEESNHAGAVVEENFEIRKVETSKALFC